MKKYFVFILILASFTCLYAGELRISLKVKKHRFLFFEPINLKYTLQNTTDKFLIIPAIRDNFIIEDDQGNITRPRYGPRTLEMKGPCNNRIILKPHQLLERPLWNVPLGTPLKVGDNKVTFEMDGSKFDCTYFDNYTNENTIIWRGKLRTSPVSITVLPPEGVDLEVLKKYKMEGIREARAGRYPRDELFNKYPQSIYTLWIYMEHYRSGRAHNKCLIQGEMGAVADSIKSEERLITGDEKLRKSIEKSIEENKQEIKIMESLAKYHQSSDEIIHLLYRIGEHYLSIYDYSKAKETFHKITTMTPKAECDDLFIKSSKRFITALRKFGK